MNSEHQYLDPLDRLSVQIETLHRLSVTSNDLDRSVMDSLLTEKTKSLCLLSEEINCAHQAIKLAERLPPTGYIPYNIGNRIQIARENLDMSLDDLAAAVIPDDVEVVSEWENGKSEPCASEIIRLSQALKCDPMWLLTGKECAK
ncbi:TPA: helix-turn-helix domain-containing protein [Salmonella enterica]|nr:helix-turn-helix domain-containing protein [Salmonella enterica]